MSVRWGVRGVSKIEAKRKNFKHESQITDPVTGETVAIFPAVKRLRRQLLQIPFALGAATLLGALIATCFGIEVFISEVYKGPFKGVLVCYGSLACYPLADTSRSFYLLELLPLLCLSSLVS